MPLSAPPAVTIRVADLSSVPGDPRLLEPPERDELRSQRLRGRRREEWIRGRVAIRRAVSVWLRPRGPGCVVQARPNGAPQVVGLDCAVSLSHDDHWFAVALAAGRACRIGIDLCRRAHAERVVPILQRFTARGVQIDPVVQWAALECVLKMRGLRITALLGSDARVQRGGERVWVDGLGPPAVLSVKEWPEFVVVWGSEDP